MSSCVGLKVKKPESSFERLLWFTEYCSVDLLTDSLPLLSILHCLSFHISLQCFETLEKRSVCFPVTVVQIENESCIRDETIRSSRCRTTAQGSQLISQSYSHLIPLSPGNQKGIRGNDHNPQLSLAGNHKSYTKPKEIQFTS